MEVLATLRRFDWPDFGSESGANPPPPLPPPLPWPPSRWYVFFVEKHVPGP